MWEDWNYYFGGEAEEAASINRAIASIEASVGGLHAFTDHHPDIQTHIDDALNQAKLARSDLASGDLENARRRVTNAETSGYAAAALLAEMGVDTTPETPGVAMVPATPPGATGPVLWPSLPPMLPPGLSRAAVVPLASATVSARSWKASLLMGAGVLALGAAAFIALRRK